MKQQHFGLVACCAGAVGLSSGALADCWELFAGSAARESRTSGEFPSLVAPAWVASLDNQGRLVQFVGQSGVVCDPERVYALGETEGISYLLAYRKEDGGCVWTAPVPDPHVSSWSTPAVDEVNGAVLVGAGRRLITLDAATGMERWSVELEQPVVNASPLVTDDRGPADRVFITDYDGFGDNARLYCVNVDAFEAQTNPYEPGREVWSVGIGSAAGSTPAYADGVVYVVTAGPGGFGAGRVLAFDAGATAEPSPLWEFTNVKAVGFHGGVSVVDGAVYAASYSYFGGRTSANLVKLDAATGALAWSVGCNRTDTTPVVTTDGRVVVSGGLAGFGSLPTLQLFRDDGDSATMVWDSASATWDDVDGDGSIGGGEYLPIGGWTHQPVLSTANGGAVLLAGAIPTGGEQYTACTDLHQIDLDVEAGEPGWIVESFSGTGSTPAVVEGVVFTIGVEGLFAFGGCGPDCDGSGGLDLFDFLCFQNAFAAEKQYGDCDGDEVFTLFDFLCFQNGFVEGCG
jgi:outer membrane protein assembly factor BamB